MKIIELVKMLSLSKNTVHHDQFDQYVFNDIKNYTAMKDIEYEFPTLPELIFDTFNLFYKLEPKFLDDNEIHPEYRINKTILQKAVNTEEYDRLRNITKLDEMNSAVATVSFIKTIIAELLKDKEIKKQIENIQNTINDMLNTANQLQAVNDPNTQQQLQQQLNTLQQQLSNQVSQLQQSVPQLVVSKAIHRASESAKEFKEAETAVMMWGTEAGKLTRLPADERIRLANVLLESRKLRELAKMLGKMKNIFASVKKSKVRRPVSEIYDVTMSSDVERAIPFELAKLNIPEMRLDFLKRFAEGQLMTYKLRDKQKLAKGDFVACIDVSGSMEGQKEIWAKAVALACLDQAMKQKRRFALVFFDTKVQYTKVFEKKLSIGDIREIAEFFTGGGTNFEKPLMTAMDIIDSGKLKNADILFITDGEYRVSDKFVDELEKFKKSTKTRIVSVFVTGWGESELRRFSDKVIHVKDLMNDVAEVFAQF